MTTQSENSEVQKNNAKKTNIVPEPKEFGKRLVANLFVLGLIFVLGFATLIVTTDMVEEKTQNAVQTLFDYAAKAGLTLDDVVVVGRDKTSKSELLSILQVKRGDNFLKINIHDMKERIEHLPWVKNAIVKRKFFPNVLEISLEERQVRSIWQINEKFHPIDEDGLVIDAPFTPKKPILLIVGEGAPENINQLLKIISSNKKVFERVKVANFISHRRWDLVFDDIQNGVTVKLPEEHVEEAWKKLLNLDAVNGILKRKLTIIDLRLKGKITVTLKKTEGKAPVLRKNLKENRV